MHDNRTTLTQFLIEEQRHIAGATGDFTSLLNDIVTACKVISSMVNHGELMGVLGQAGSENVQGEDQKKLDVISNEVFLKTNEWAGHLAAMASEEMEAVYPIPSHYPKGKYLLTFDPLDGSSNIDVNVSNMRFWVPPVRRYVEECLAGREGPRGEDFNMRWIASMVAEVHRILTRGGLRPAATGGGRAPYGRSWRRKKAQIASAPSKSLFLRPSSRGSSGVSLPGKWCPPPSTRYRITSQPLSGLV